MSDKDRPRGVKANESMESDSELKDCQSGESTSGQSDAKRVKRTTREEKEKAMLPDLKPAPGIICYFVIVYKIYMVRNNTIYFFFNCIIILL